MDKQHFDQLVKGVKVMKRHTAGKTVRGAVSVELPVPDVRAIREAAHVTEPVFQIDWRELANLVKLGITLHRPTRSA